MTELIFKKNKPEEVWLNDEDIKNYFNSITTKYNIEEGNVLLFENAFILGNLVERFNSGTPIGRSANGLIKKIKKNNFVFIPACQGNSHWTLFVYDKNNKTFHHYNSYEEVNNLQYFCPFLKSNNLGVEVEKNKINFEEHKTPQQGNGDDCGVFVIAITEFLVRRYQKNSAEMSWEINSDEAEEIKKNVPTFRKMLEEGNDYFNELSTETTQKRDAKLDQIKAIITQAQTIFAKNEATKGEITQVIDSLKVLANATTGSIEAQVWAENLSTNQKLLIGLTEKLSKKTTDDYNDNVPKNETKSGKNKPKPAATEFSNSGGDEVSEENDDDSKTSQTPQTSQPEQGKFKTKFQNDINKAQNGADDDKVKAIKNSGRILGEEGFEKEKAQIAALEEELAISNPPKYLEAIIGKIEENLKKNKLSIEELDTEIQEEIRRIKDNKDNKDKINEINDAIGNQGAKKRFNKLKTKVSKISKLSKEKIKKLRDKLLRVINSSNKYEHKYKVETRSLLAKLDSYQIQKPINNKFPTSWVVGGGVALAIGLAAMIIIRKQKKRKVYFKK